MPRKGPAPRRELQPDPIYKSILVTQVVNKILQHGKRSTAERIVYNALEVLSKRLAPSQLQRSSARSTTSAPPSKSEPPCRWRHLPGPGRGPTASGQHPCYPLDHELCRRAPRAHDGRAAGERDPRCLKRHRRVGQAQGRSAQDGRIKQGLRPLPLVAALPFLFGLMSLSPPPQVVAVPPRR